LRYETEKAEELRKRRDNFFKVFSDWDKNFFYKLWSVLWRDFFFLEKFTLPKCQVNIKYSKKINTYIRIYIKPEIFYINTNSIITLALFTEKYKFWNYKPVACNIFHILYQVINIKVQNREKYLYKYGKRRLHF